MRKLNDLLKRHCSGGGGACLIYWLTMLSRPRGPERAGQGQVVWLGTAELGTDLCTAPRFHL